MDEMVTIDAVERYIRGEMNPDERLYFEQLRKTNPEIDQQVVEHTLFLQQINRFGEWQKFRGLLQNVHTDLAEKGQINSTRLKGKAKVIYLWNKYKRVTAIAASIAGVTALMISALVWSNIPESATPKEVQNLRREISSVKAKNQELEKEIDGVKSTLVTTPIVYKTGGTGFLVDPNGYIVTNYHVVQNARNIAVQNIKGKEYPATLVYHDVQRDLAILKINDDGFKTLGSIPYSIKKSSTEIAESIYTLGYPRNEIVYGEGYLSAKTGYNDDTLSCQIAIPANPGNSGGPVLNKQGEVIGILSARQTTAQGVVFATQARYIFTALEALKKTDTSFHEIKMPEKSSIKFLDRVQQVKKVEQCVYMVKVN